MAVISAVQSVLGQYTYAQEEITTAFGANISPDGQHVALVEKIHAATGVKQRHLVMDFEGYKKLDGFGSANDAYIQLGADLGAEAIRGALAKANLEPTDIDMVMCVSVTGIAAPSLEALLARRLGMREDVKRLPIFGLGCVAGAAGIARVRDYLAGDPNGVAVLLSVELCSLTLQRTDVSIPNVVASGLFGDGAAAVVMLGEERARRMGISGPQVVATRSRLYPDTERTMGWDVCDSGFRLFLSANVADVVSDNLEVDVKGFLADHGLTVPQINRWVCHPGGPKILEAMQDSLSLHDGELEVTWRSLARIGNLSSASVLHILQDTMEGRDGAGTPEPGTPGLLMAMGPGFCAELVLLRW